MPRKMALDGAVPSLHFGSPPARLPLDLRHTATDLQAATALARA